MVVSIAPPVTPTPTNAAPPPRRHGRRGVNGTKLGLIAPGAVIYAVVVLVPILVNFFYAFTDWDGYTSSFAFIGLDNFSRLAGDVDARRAFINTCVFTALNAPLQIGIGLALALVVNRPGRLIALIRVVVVLPIAISGVVLGFLGTIIFDPGKGILATIGELPGLGLLAQNWLGDADLAMVSVVAMQLWQWSGFTMLVFLAGLATIPGELHEAARLDGAGALARFRHVTWPLLAPAATINVVLTIIGGFKVFDIIYVLTGGGPGGATESIVMRVNSQASFADYGYSAATSFSITVIVFAISALLLLVLRAREIQA